MDLVTLVVLALGLSMDAFAVSVSNAMCYKDLSRRQAALTSLSFGLFQGAMPTIGFFAGRLVGRWIAAADHWLALVLLGIIGGKMIVEGVRALRRPESCDTTQRFGAKTLLMQSLATSIDALAVGISFAALSVNIFAAALSIALITFACCLIGSELGRRFGALLGDWAQILGGLILVGIGLKTFIEHMMTGV